jgi:hypothetical protein
MRVAMLEFLSAGVSNGAHGDVEVQGLAGEGVVAIQKDDREQWSQGRGGICWFGLGESESTSE